jgi:GT2 family glycosyltransferase
MISQTDLAVVAIGRNEGDRLIQCLASLQNGPARVVYVDSGSDDDSIAAAKAAGAEVVALDRSKPFTAARARNAGFAALRVSGPDYVQFLDGDCRVCPGWLDAAHQVLDSEPGIGIVTGWRSEINRDRSVYNAMCDFEWHRPAGEITTCGGDMMVRFDVFEKVGGFNDTVIAAEDDEFCVRVRQAGWRMRRIPVAMTRHDADMTRFAQWWRRAVRSGHGFAQVGAMHPGCFLTERRRVWVFGAVLPIFIIAGLFAGMAWVAWIGLALYGVSYLRSVFGLRRDGLPDREAVIHAGFLTLSKFPNLLGMIIYWWRRMQGQKMQLIEYK